MNNIIGLISNTDPDPNKEYEKYLLSEHWQQKRAEALARAGFKCQICSSKSSLEVHHNSYENLWEEPISDLVVLCGGCHSLFHKKRKIKKTSLKERKKNKSLHFSPIHIRGRF